MLTLHLTTDKAILLKDILMSQLQQTRPESRPAIQEILDDVKLYLAIELREVNDVRGKKIGKSHNRE